MFFITFTDFINSMNLESSGTSFLQIIATMALTFALSLVIFWVYKRTYQGVMYSKSYNVSLIALALVTSSVIMAVTSNIILSLGMVGALSIVRFRAAIKDPMDIVYMFWAISAGIITGARLYIIAIVTCVIIAVVLLIYSKLRISEGPCLIIIGYTDSAIEDQLFHILNNHGERYKIKSRIQDDDHTEMTIELSSDKKSLEITNQLKKLNSVMNVAMMSYDGEYAA